MFEVDLGVLSCLGVNQTDGAEVVGEKRNAIHTSTKYQNSVLLSSLDIDIICVVPRHIYIYILYP